MAVKKLPSGKWQAQVFPEGRDGRRIRRLFTTKGEAMAFIPISPELFASLPRRRGRLFKDCYEAFRDAVTRAKQEPVGGGGLVADSQRA